MRPAINRLTCAVVLLAGLAACAEQRINLASEFATKAEQYEAMVPPLLDKTFEAVVRADSQQLIRSRPGDEAARILRLEKSDKQFERELEINDAIKEQVELLKSVFAALGALATSDAASSINVQTRGVIEQLNTLTTVARDFNLIASEDFRENKEQIGTVLTAGVDLSVAQFQSAALREFMEDYGPTVVESLVVQEQLLQLIADRLTHYEKLNIEDRRTETVTEPYVKGDAPSLEAWVTARKDIYNSIVDLQDVDAAKTAARDTRLAFVALAENRLTLQSIDLISQDVARVERVLAALSEFRSSETTGTEGASQ